MRRMAEYSGKFCCANGEPEPADTFYDMNFDIVPHTDRCGRTFESPWFPVNGVISMADWKKLKNIPNK